jgi:ketosteroid isomerase-like protein
MPMDSGEKKTLIESFIRAYNNFDVDGMVSLMHRDCVFRNVSGGQVNASTTGIEQFRELAEASKAMFSSRHQEVTGYREDGDAAVVDIAFEAVLYADLPDGPKAGATLSLNGQSVFEFRDGLICRLTDTS